VEELPKELLHQSLSMAPSRWTLSNPMKPVQKDEERCNVEHATHAAFELNVILEGSEKSLGW
jgi:hypothetical protein